MNDLIAVTIYTSGPSCMACTQTKRHLNRRGIPYTETTIDSDGGILAAAAELELRTAPIICVSTTAGDHYWDGYRPDRIDWLAQLL